MCIFRKHHPKLLAIKNSWNKPPLVKNVWELLCDWEGKDPSHCAEEEFERLAFPELKDNKVGGCLKPSFYRLAGECAKKGLDEHHLSAGMHNIADHLAQNGGCENCRKFWGESCPNVSCPGSHKGYYPFGGKTHTAFRAWLENRFTPASCKPYITADENYLSECFHAALLKYAPKRIAWGRSMKARLAMAILQWNEACHRGVKNVHLRKNFRANEFHKRAGCVRRLEEAEGLWKKDCALGMGLFY